MNIDLTTLNIAKAHEGLMSGAFTAVDLANAYLSVIKSKNTDINAYLEVYADVIKQAEEADKNIKAKVNINPLIGIPFSIKDNILIEGKRVGASSKILDNYIAPYDATAISKLKEKGVVFIGRVNMDEFAMGGSTENSAYGTTKNPHDLERVAGGSSGGSAASVAMDGALVSLGSDTGGSVRQPASFCGVVGLKPTYGSISRHGLMAMGSSLDVIGPLGKTVEDVEIVFNAIKGEDQYDATSFYSETNQPVKAGSKLKIGIVKGLLDQGGIDVEVKKNFADTIEKLKTLGYSIVEVELPYISYSLAVYYVIMPAEVSSNMARFDGMKYGVRVSGANLLEDYLETRAEGLGREVRRRIMLGTYVLSSGYYDAYYGKANKVRALIKNDFKKAFGQVDALLTPTTPSASFKIGEKTKDPLSMYLEDIFTVPANLAGIPAMSVPSGKTINSLPLGIQIMSEHYREDILFSLGKDIETIRS
jgi:aspartyl-tRNA(Asn)/glutamyl-tRNA(Gln) amidotransferase subunit A